MSADNGGPVRLMTAEIARGIAEHSAADHHEIIRLLSVVEGQLAAALAGQAAALAALAELAGKVEQLEQEFGPLARKYSGSVARLAVTRAAGWRGRNEQSDR